MGNGSGRRIHRMKAIRTDFEALEDGARLVLYPTEDNPLHKEPVAATYSGGFFYCDGTSEEEGPDYFFGDVFLYNHGFTLELRLTA